MKGAVIGGIIVLIAAAVFTWNSVGHYMESSSNPTDTAELTMAISAGGVGLFFGIFFILIGFKSRSSAKDTP
jgi:divalent metal cation (Fe/Co/Zn/Cd) transporter